MPIKSTDFQVPFNGKFKVCDSPTALSGTKMSDQSAKKALKKEVKRLSTLQDRLYAADTHAVLLVFQAMDAAGKDSTIRAVTSGVNPAGFQVTSFKTPSKQELEHDFLWRTTQALPQRGRIGIFNRSHYEETLVVRVHPEYLEHQRLPNISEHIWQERFEAIRNYEKHLRQNGTLILKFWLNVSRKEQLNRFTRRLERPEKNWKFSGGDLKESARWQDYMDAYESMLNETSRPYAPWFAVPADNKAIMRLTVATIVNEALENLELKYPRMAQSEQDKIPEYLAAIEQARSTL
jgi:PPK2 family polyphosphate:nucleotide phosphotransferase